MKQKILEDIKEKTLHIFKRADIKKAAIFGSFVRGDNTNKSDIDILVAFPDSATLVDVAHLKHELENLLKKKVDLVSYNAISPLIKDSILKYQYRLV